MIKFRNFSPIHWMNNFHKFHEDWVKIVDFSIKAYFWASNIFSSVYLTTHKEIKIDVNSIFCFIKILEKLTEKDLLVEIPSFWKVWLKVTSLDENLEKDVLYMMTVSKVTETLTKEHRKYSNNLNLLLPMASVPTKIYNWDLSHDLWMNPFSGMNWFYVKRQVWSFSVTKFIDHT